VLGTLTGGARRRFEALLPASPVLRRAVAEWQDRLVPMAEFAPTAQPSPQVWRKIAQKLQLQQAAAAATSGTGFWDRLAFWRGLGLASTVLATILVGVLVVKQFEVTAPATTFVAMLSDEQSKPVAVVTGDPVKHQLTIRLVSNQVVAPDKSLELWAVPKTGAPRSLGLLASDGSITLPLPDNASPQSIPLLAVTLEPKGGSPKADGPTGPIVFKGAWVKV
jgi:anti-sigma-K factor RskA